MDDAARRRAHEGALICDDFVIASARFRDRDPVDVGTFGCKMVFVAQR
jgi:hypothetical protein